MEGISLFKAAASKSGYQHFFPTTDGFNFQEEETLLLYGHGHCDAGESDGAEEKRKFNCIRPASDDTVISEVIFIVNWTSELKWIFKSLLFATMLRSRKNGTWR